MDTLTKLTLSDNSLTGWVPESLAELKKLKTLTLGNNFLSGSLPKDICRFEDLEVLSVDCDAQGCECCTDCTNPQIPSQYLATKSPSSASPSEPLVRFTPPPIETLAPVDQPSSSPTVSPTTSSPTKCNNSISVLSGCYEPLDDVEVSLSNCVADRDDWVGLYLVDEGFDSDRLSNPNIWSWACGTRNCREEVYTNFIPLNNIHARNDEWPLELGTYVIILARNSAQPYTAYAVSDEFVISESC